MELPESVSDCNDARLGFGGIWGGDLEKIKVVKNEAQQGSSQLYSAGQR
jgi:hypothetical protein